MPLPFEPHRFSSAVPYYVRGRLAYPASLIARVAELSGLRLEHRVLDLGCGPGFLAAAFAPRSSQVVAIDPEPAMLEAARAYVGDTRDRIEFVLGSSYDLGPRFGLFHLATLGRSFHWMDRETTLKALAGITDETGVVALFADSHLELPENRWARRLKEFLDPYNKRDASYVARNGPGADWLQHEEFLLNSPFARVERISSLQRLFTPVDTLVARVLSQSATSPEKLGAETASFTERVRKLFLEEARDGLITEVVEFHALLGHKQN